MTFRLLTITGVPRPIKWLFFFPVLVICVPVSVYSAAHEANYNKTVTNMSIIIDDNTHIGKQEKTAMHISAGKYKNKAPKTDEVLSDFPSRREGAISETSVAGNYWKKPINGKPLKIVVPGGKTYDRFVKVVHGEKQNKNKYDGFSIQVFHKAHDLLEHPLPYKFEANNGSYDDLVQLVYNKTYDAVVGDITILEDRLQYVDFTLPYTESSLVIIAPTTSARLQFMFTEPFTWQLWVSTAALFLFTTLIVWLLERQPNEDFGREWWKKIFVALWFTFSTLFFVHRENIRNTYTRLVLVFWLLIVMILTACYTSTLSSMLTVQQLRPTVAEDLESLKTLDLKVGCGNKFICDYVKRVHGFKSENVVMISGEDMYLAEFKSKNISAAFFELPYARYFCNKYCKQFTSSAVASTKYGGFGFAFQKELPIVWNFSKAILKLSENGVLKSLEDEWLTPSNACTTDDDSSDKPKRLGIQGFEVLYLLSALISIICLLFNWIVPLDPPEPDGENRNRCRPPTDPTGISPRNERISNANGSTPSSTITRPAPASIN